MSASALRDVRHVHGHGHHGDVDGAVHEPRPLVVVQQLHRLDVDLKKHGERASSVLYGVVTGVLALCSAKR